MTPEQQRIAIAEACGFINARMWGESCIACMGITSEGKYWGGLGVPDYLNDLNAMHEAEKILNLHQQLRYQIELGGYMADNDYWSLYHSTAAKRAEAFLKTIDKWTTNEPTKP